MSRTMKSSNELSRVKSPFVVVKSALVPAIMLIGQPFLSVNKKRRMVIKMLEDGKYDSDPIKAWKESIEKVGNNVENSRCHV